MKYVIAVIQPEKLDEVLDRLTEKEIHLVTVSEVKGRGRQKGIPAAPRGHEREGDLLPKVKLEIVVEDIALDQVLKIILDKARTGEKGDGKIFVTPVEDALRIRTGDRGKEAL